MMICPECGMACEDGSEYCIYCGYRFEDDEGSVPDREALNEKLAGLANDPHTAEENPGAMCYAPAP